MTIVLTANIAAFIVMRSRPEPKQYKQQYKCKESKLSSHQPQSISHFNQTRIKPRATSKLLPNNKFNTPQTPTNKPNTRQIHTNNTQNTKQLQNTTEVRQALQSKQAPLMLLALQSIKDTIRIQDIQLILMLQLASSKDIQEMLKVPVLLNR